MNWKSIINSNATDWNFEEEEIGAEGARHIADALKVNKTVHTIDLNWSQIGDVGARHIADALKVNNTVQSINLTWNQIGDEGARHIADALKVNKTVQSIYLLGNQIGAEGARHIADALKVNTKVVVVSLDINQIGDEGGRHIADALKVNKTLYAICLTNNQIGDVGARHIADALKVNNTVKSIILDDNQIGDVGARHIAEALKVNKTVHLISLERNPASKLPRLLSHKEEDEIRENKSEEESKSDVCDEEIHLFSDENDNAMATPDDRDNAMATPDDRHNAIDILANVFTDATEDAVVRGLFQPGIRPEIAHFGYMLTNQKDKIRKLNVEWVNYWASVPHNIEVNAPHIIIGVLKTLESDIIICVWNGVGRTIALSSSNVFTIRKNVHDAPVEDIWHFLIEDRRRMIRFMPTALPKVLFSPAQRSEYQKVCTKFQSEHTEDQKRRKEEKARHQEEEARRKEEERIGAERLALYKRCVNAIHTATDEDAAAAVRFIATGTVDVQLMTYAPHDYGTLLHEAVRRDKFETANAIVKAAPETVTTFDQQMSHTPMHEAAARDGVRYLDLFEKHASVDIEARNGRTPLHTAAQQNCVKAATWLLDHQANVNALDKEKQTPLLLACEDGRMEVARLLVERGADLSAKRSRDNKTALDILQAGDSDARSLAKEFIKAAAERDLKQVVVRETSAWQREVKGRDSYAKRWKWPHEENDVVSKALESVRTHKFDVLADTSFEVEPVSRHAAVYLALAMVDAQDICEPSDVEERLDEYEAQCVADSLPMSPLLLLARARHIQLLSNSAQAVNERRIALLQLFKAHCSDYNEWLDKDTELPLANGVLPTPSTPRDNVRLPSSTSEVLQADWDKLKAEIPDKKKHKPMDELMELVGLDAVKRIALRAYSDVLADQRLKANNKGKSVGVRTLNFAFMGNPGTGKTTVARLFAELLEQAGARAGHKFVQMTGGEALRKGAKTFAMELASLTGGKKGVGPPPEQILRKGMDVEVKDSEGKWYPGKISSVDKQKNVYAVVYADGTEEEDVVRDRVRALGEAERVGGVLFLDEAYDLDPANNPDGRAIVNELMSAAEDHRDKVTIILAGYKDDIEKKLYAFNDGIPSRFISVPFEDFDEDQLAQVWRSMCEKFEWHSSADVTRVAARRVVRGRGQKGFGNARTVRKLFDAAVSEAKHRYRDGVPTLIVEDVIGKEPTEENIPELKRTMDQLRAMTGLARVKECIQELVDMARSNYKNEQANQIDAITDVPLNRLFLGNPGTGKTTVAAIYGRVLKALRFLSNGEVVSKTASDFIGDHVGESQKKTRSILALSEGKVLLIDEAYGLDDLLYGKQALDTIVEQVHGNAGDDIAVVMIGYKPQMMKMLREQNPGLTRRFDPDSAFEFDDFNDRELLSIFSAACNRSAVVAPFAVKQHAVRMLAKRRRLPNFGNAGVVNNLVGSAKRRMLKRIGAHSGAVRRLELIDIDEGYGDTRDPLSALDELEESPVREWLEGVGKKIAVRRKEGETLDGLVTNLIFTGAPGTGKTTVARAIGKVLDAYGLLAKSDVVETSAPDLIGAYVGHSRQNVEKKMEEARGGVLFIDEAYKLGVGSFGEEAIMQLLTMLTLPEHIDGKTVVILAGYKQDMHAMLESNVGLKSRFKKEVEFDDWSADKCVSLVCSLAKKAQPSAFAFESEQQCISELKRGFVTLMDERRTGWANARDAKRMFDDLKQVRELRVYDAARPVSASKRTFTLGDVRRTVDEFVRSRPLSSGPKVRDAFMMSPPMAEAFANASQQRQREREREDNDEANERNEVEKREEESMQDSESEQSFESLLDEVDKLLTERKDMDEQHRQALEEERRRLEEEKRKRDELERLRREAEEAAKRARDEAERQRLLAEQRRLEEEARRRAEAERKRQRILRALQMVGRCPAGFCWHRRGSGFQCGGGSHFASLDAVARQAGVDVEDVNSYWS